MTRFVRKNLMVDAETLRELARERGVSESQAVRDAVQMALATQEMVKALKGLHDIGAFADFEQLFPPLEAEETSDNANGRLPECRPECWTEEE